MLDLRQRPIVPSCCMIGVYYCGQQIYLGCHAALQLRPYAAHLLMLIALPHHDHLAVYAEITKCALDKE